MIALLGMAGGVFIAILFGINEDLFKNKIAEGLKQNTAIQSISEESVREKKIESEKAKNWRYYQRFHFHATGIGAMSLATLLLISFLGAPTKSKLIAQYSTSLGGFFYPFVWLFAAIWGPCIGRSAAKEQFAVFAYMGGVFLFGLIFTVFLLSKYPLKKD